MGSASALASSSASGAADSAIVIAVTEIEVTFAVCQADGGAPGQLPGPATGIARTTALIKRALTMNLLNCEMFRPSARKQSILGLRGRNVFELFTQQARGHDEVGFVFALKQSHPWSGSPRIADFEAITTTVNAFSNPSNVEILNTAVQKSSGAATATAPTASGGQGVAGAAAASATAEGDQSNPKKDQRVFVALKPPKFNPELRFGGDVSVNVETILGWLSIRQDMVPQLFICHLADPLEVILSSCDIQL
jgi:hypothetical protein